MMHSPSIRIAILEADTPLENTKAKYGGYGGVFASLLQAGTKALLASENNNNSSNNDGIATTVPALKISKHQIVDDPTNYPDLNDVDAVLITGSRYDAFADTHWTNKLTEYAAKVLAQDRVRLIGVCFGHQIIGRALGVKVGRNDTWEAAVHQVDLTEKGKQLFGKDKLAIHQMHRDIVFSYPEGVEPLGSSPVCKVQGMYTPKKLLTIQGHPEFNEEIMREILKTRHQTGIFDEDAYKEHISKVALSHDGIVVSMAFLRFLME